MLSEEIEHHVKEEEKRVEGMFAQARAAGLDMDALADAMRARKKTAMEEFQAGKPAETRTMAGDKGVEDAPLNPAPNGSS